MNQKYYRILRYSKYARRESGIIIKCLTDEEAEYILKWGGELKLIG